MAAYCDWISVRVSRAENAACTVALRKLSVRAGGKVKVQICHKSLGQHEIFFRSPRRSTLRGSLWRYVKRDGRAGVFDESSPTSNKHPSKAFQHIKRNIKYRLFANMALQNARLPCLFWLTAHGLVTSSPNWLLDMVHVLKKKKNRSHYRVDTKR